MTRAEASFNRADRLYHGSIKLFFAFAFIMLCVIAYEVINLRGNFNESQRQTVAQRDEDAVATRQRLEKALKETQQQQVVTQNYIRCIASVLLKPVEDRREADFNACGIPGVTDPSKLGQPTTNQNSVISTGEPRTITPQVTPAPPQPTQPTPNQPTTGGSPPDDDALAAEPTATEENFVTPPAEEPSDLGKLPIVGGLLNAIGL